MVLAGEVLHIRSVRAVYRPPTRPSFHAHLHLFFSSSSSVSSWGLFSVPHYAPLGKLAEWYKQELMQPDMARGNTSAAAFHARVYGDATCTSTNCSGYDSFKHQFRAELWDPNDWVALFQRAGARGLQR